MYQVCHPAPDERLGFAETTDPSHGRKFYLETRPLGVEAEAGYPRLVVK
jgi:hypothetical protein